MVAFHVGTLRKQALTLGELKEAGLGKGRSWTMRFRLNEQLSQPYKELSSWDGLESKHLGPFISIVFRCTLHWEDSMTLSEVVLFSQGQFPKKADSWQHSQQRNIIFRSSQDALDSVAEYCPLEHKLHEGKDLASSLLSSKCLGQSACTCRALHSVC